MTTTRFACDLAGGYDTLAHVWETMVGSGHATLALRADWQRQLGRCHRELGFRYVRCHGILSDDMGTLMCERDELVYSFFNADSMLDFLRSIDMRPVVELSFMPTALASGDATVFHYRGNITPPKHLSAWQALIAKLVQHWVDRFGVEEVRTWMFEVWNEPNLPAFWTGTQAQYFDLYECAARAIKAVDPALRVGGPASAQNAWIPDLLEHCSRSGIPIDFISTHHYPTDAFGEPGDDTEAQLAASHRGVLREQALQAHREARGKPLYYTEWSTSSNPFDPLHDEAYAAAYIVKTVLEVRSLVEGYSYWTFSDIFEENYFSSTPFHGGFGLLTIHGIPKPAYRAYELLHRLGEQILPVTGSHPTVDVWVTRADNRLAILIANGALPRHPIASERVIVELRGITAAPTIHVERIDDDHANAKRGWLEMGAPEHLSAHDVEKLEALSRLERHPLKHRRTEAGIEMELQMPPRGTALVTLEL